jgi:hypothetical protein
MSAAHGWADRGNGTAQAVGHVPRCPVCKHQLDGLGTMDPRESAVPEPGCGTVCLGCTSILWFDDNLQLEPMPFHAWEKLEVADRAQTEKTSLGAAHSFPLREPIMLIAWHATGWYGIALYPDHLFEQQHGHAFNVIARSKRYETRAALDQIAKTGVAQTLFRMAIRQDVLSGRWSWGAILESTQFQWSVVVASSEPLTWGTKAEAMRDGEAVSPALRARFGLQSFTVLYKHGQAPKGPLS